MVYTQYVKVLNIQLWFFTIFFLFFIGRKPYILY